MKHIKIFENFNKYEEIEFVCYNTETKSDTSAENRLALYNDLKKVDGLLPYMQDWSDSEHIQKSLAVIILDKDLSLKPLIIELMKKHNMEIDIEDYVPGSKVDEILGGELENLV